MAGSRSEYLCWRSPAAVSRAKDGATEKVAQKSQENALGRSGAVETAIRPMTRAIDDRPRGEEFDQQPQCA